MLKLLFKTFFFSFILFTSNQLYGKIRLPLMVSDSMVIQRDVKVRVWGWADKGEQIKVTFRGKSYKTTTAGDGMWILWLTASKAGGPFTMKIAGKNESIVLNNILVGDVWLCAGQSNMVHYLDLHKDRYRNEIASANFPEIRQFLVPANAVVTGQTTDVSGGSWKAARSANVLKFSVVAYFFAKNLYEKYHVPIGLINASVGGTPIEAWTSEQGLSEFPEMLATVQKNKDTAYVNGMNRHTAVIRKNIEARKNGDAGLKESPAWFDTTYVAKDWHSINIPGYWEDQGIKELNGSVWYRKEIDVPQAMKGKPARLDMGRIVDADFVYLNGKLVGNTGYQYPQRRYTVPAGLLKKGKNVIVIRVINQGGKGGFVPDKPYYLAAGKDTIDLKGTWKYKVGEVFVPQSENGGGISLQNQPASLFNGMLAPFTKYAIKGVIWYQGEANTNRADQYQKLTLAFINDLRFQWEKFDLPFLYVQLPGFMDVNYLPSESQWAALREAQRKTLRVPNTAMAVAIDLGEWNDIHPENKKPIGDRLALAARSMVYGEKNIEFSGPIYNSAVIEGNKLIIQFDHIGSGLLSKDGGNPKWFAVAGEDRQFVWANAKIEGDKVVVWNDGIRNPVYVRYAWADNPDGVNLYNREGLPASPFEARLIEAMKLWHGRKSAVVLTYDDALDVHLDNVIPLMDSLGINGTFYLTASSPACKNRMKDWTRAARNGHELGNHTLYHPCDASKPGRSWVSPQNDLSKYTTMQITRETEMTNVFLESLDGRKERTFAYTCGDTDTGEGSFIEAITGQFVSMRGVKGELNKMESMDLKNLNCYVVDNSNADQLIAWAEKAKQENALMIVLFHGVGGGHNINVDLKKHNDFLKYLKSNPDDYWITTALEASKHIILQQKLKQK